MPRESLQKPRTCTVAPCPRTRDLYGTPHPEVATTLSNLAQVLQAQRKFGEPGRYLRRTLRMRRSLFGSSHPEIAVGLSILGTILHNRDRYVAADSAFRAARAMVRTLGSTGQVGSSSSANTVDCFGTEASMPRPSRPLKGPSSWPAACRGSIHPRKRTFAPNWPRSTRRGENWRRRSGIVMAEGDGSRTNAEGR